MRYRRIGDTDLEVSIVGLGCNNFGMRCDDITSVEVVHAALDHGINFFDTADVYGGTRSEALLGKALDGGRREQVIIATKFANTMPDGGKGASAQYIERAVEQSLERLGTDRIDLYQQHVPDADTPIDETLTALDRLVQSGKVRHIGHSNFNAQQINEADSTAQALGVGRFVTAQNQYNLLDRRIEAEVLPACARLGLGMLPYFPLASGLLTGKYTRGEAPPETSRLANFGERGRKALSEENFDRVEPLSAFASARGHTLLELAVSWLAANPVVSSVIAGATRVAQVESNVAAAEWLLSDDELAEVAELTAR